MPQGAANRLNAALAEVLARNPRDAEEREEAIEDVCRDDLALAREVRRRLAEQREATQPTEAGIRALGPYLLLSQIGEGGMGAVYRARDTRLRREVAVKVLSPAVAAQPDLVARFEREARAVAALSHRNVVVIYDVGYEADTHFIVMELLDGQSLREAAARGRMPAARAIRYILQVCDGLAAAHAKGIVHRDLKPGNIILTRDGRAVLVDFGIAKTLTDGVGDQSTFVTTAGGVLGTPQYMSPEQVRGLRVDHRSDIFSLGIVLFELLSGESAFERPTLADCLSAVLTEDPLARWDGEAHPPELRRVVQRCLDKDPERRFQSTTDLAAAVGPLAESPRAGSGADLEEGAGARTIAPSGPEVDVQFGVPRTSAVGPRIAGGAAVAAALLVAAGVWMTGGEEPVEAPAVPAIDGSAPAPPAGPGPPSDLEPAPPPAPPPVEESSRDDGTRAARKPPVQLRSHRPDRRGRAEAVRMCAPREPVATRARGSTSQPGMRIAAARSTPSPGETIGTRCGWPSPGCSSTRAIRSCGACSATWRATRESGRARRAMPPRRRPRCGQARSTRELTRVSRTRAGSSTTAGPQPRSARSGMRRRCSTRRPWPPTSRPPGPVPPARRQIRGVRAAETTMPAGRESARRSTSSDARTRAAARPPSGAWTRG